MTKPEEMEELASTKLVFSSSTKEIVKLAEQLDDTTWKVISDNPVVIDCGDFTLTLNFSDTFRRSSDECLLPYLQEKTNLIKYLLAVQPKNFLPQK